MEFEGVASASVMNEAESTLDDILAALEESNRLLAQCASTVSTCITAIDHLDAELRAAKAFSLLTSYSRISAERIPAVTRQLRLRVSIINEITALLQQMDRRAA